MIYLFEEFSLDSRACELRRHGALLRVEKRVFDLILLLLESRERVMLKQEIVDNLWEGRRVSESSLTVAMAAARKVLADTVEPHRIIQTQYARGYRFVAQVSTLDASSDYEPTQSDGHSSSRFREFVGRHDELNLLFGAYESIHDAGRQLLLVSGEAGIGKSRLLGEFAGKAAHHGAAVLFAKCLEQDGSPPYWPWIQVLRSVQDGATSGQPLLEAASAALAEMLPEDSSGKLLEVARGEAGRSRFRLFDRVRRVLCELSRRGPVVLCIDDVHRADPASLFLLEFLVQQTDREPLLILLADRDTETRRSPMHSQILSRVCQVASSTGIVLSGLDEVEIARLVPSADNASELRDLTGGNPFFLSQLLPLIRDGGLPCTLEFRHQLPFSVKEAIARHLEGFSRESREVMNLAAVIGREFESTLLAVAVGNSLRVEQLIAEAASARLLETRHSTPHQFRFVHALVRELVYDALEPAIRREYHGRVASALERIHGDAMSHSVLSEYSLHMYRGADSGDSMRCVAACMKAGSYAGSQLAYEEAVTQYSRALEIATLHLHHEQTLHCDIHLALGAELSRTGDRSEARSHFMRSVGLARATSDSERLALAAMGCAPGFFAVEAGAPDLEVIEILREALAGIDTADLRMQSLLKSRLAMAIAWYERGSERRELCREAGEIATRLDDPGLQLQVLLAKWFAEWDPTECEVRWRVAAELIHLASAVGDTETRLLCRLFWVTCLLERGEIDEFRREVASFRDAADRLRQPEALWYATLLESVDSLHSGNLRDAEVQSSRFFSIGRLVGDANVFHSRMAQRFLMARELAEWDLLVGIASEAVEAYPGVVGWRATKTWALSEAGRVDEARLEFARLAIGGFENIPRRMDWSVTMALLSEVAVALDARQEGEVLYRLMEPLRGRLIVLGLCVLTWGCGSQFLGKLRILLGDREGGARLLAEAVAVEDAAGARAWAARSRLALAGVLLGDASVDGRSWTRSEIVGHCRDAAITLGLIDVERKLLDLQLL